MSSPTSHTLLNNPPLLPPPPRSKTLFFYGIDAPLPQVGLCRIADAFYAAEGDKNNNASHGSRRDVIESLAGAAASSAGAEGPLPEPPPTVGGGKGGQVDCFGSRGGVQSGIGTDNSEGDEKGGTGPGGTLAGGVIDGETRPASKVGDGGKFVRG